MENRSHLGLSGLSFGALIACALAIEYWFTDFFKIAPDLRIFIPMLAGFIGAVYRRKYWIPILLVSVFTAINWQTDFDTELNFQIGIPLGVLVFAWYIARRFATKTTDGPTQAHRSHWTWFTGALLLASMNAGISIGFSESLTATVDWYSGLLLIAAAFLFTASGRVSLAGFLKGFLTFVFIVYAADAVWGSVKELMPAFLTEEHEIDAWTGGYWQFVPLRLVSEFGGMFFGAWARFDPELIATLPSILAAGLTGLALTEFYRYRKIDRSGRAVRLLLWALLTLFLLSTIWLWVDPLFRNGATWFEIREQSVAVFGDRFASIWHFVEEQMVRVEVANNTRSSDTVVVTAVKRQQTFFDVPQLFFLPAYVLAGISFGLGLIGGRRSILKTTSIVTLFALVFVPLHALSRYWVFTPREFYGEWAEGVIGVFSIALTCAWLGKIAQSGSKDRVRKSELATPISLEPDLTTVSRIARMLDVSATMRSFAVLAAFIASLIGLIQLADMMRWALPEFENLGWGVEVAMVLVFAVISAILAPLMVVLIDALARENLFGVSLVLMAGSVLVTLLSGLIFLGGVLGLLDLLKGEEVWAPVNELIFSAVAGLIGVWLGTRTFRIERFLAKPIDRTQLLGMIARPTLGRRLSYLMGMPSSHWRWSAMLRPSTWMFLSARPLAYAGILIGFSVVQTDTQTYYDSWGFEESETTIWISADWGKWLAGAFLVIAIAHIAFTTAKRLASRRMWSDEESESQKLAPILFLRSFEDDQLTFRRRGLDIIGRWFDLWSFRRNVDELMVDEFEQFGPILALGKPGDNSPRFGAQRRFASHDEWQDVIRDAASKSSAIIVAVGETPGLSWELELIRDEGYLPKTIFLFPSAHARADRINGALSVFASVFPDLDSRLELQHNLPISISTDGKEVITLFAKNAPAQSYLVALRRFFRASMNPEE